MDTSRASKSRYAGLAGKTVFITGGGSGIGAAFTRAFAGQGARVGFVDIAEEARWSLGFRKRRGRRHFSSLATFGTSARYRPPSKQFAWNWATSECSSIMRGT